MTRNRTNLVQSTVEFIQGIIIEQDLTTGDQLPTIKELSLQAGLSQSTIREGLQKLTATGRLRIEHGVGTFVAQPTMRDAIQPLLDSGFLDFIPDSELFEVRKEIAVTTLALAMERSTKETQQLMQASLERLIRSLEPGSTTGILELDYALHDGIAELTGNAFLRSLVLLIRDLALQAINVQELDIDAPEYISLVRSVLDAMATGNLILATSSLTATVSALTLAEGRRNLIVYCDALGAGSTGGSFFTLGQKISAILDRHAGVHSTVQLTGGGLENVRLAEAAKIGLGIAQIDVAVEAFNGEGDFEHPHTNIRAIAPLGGLELHVFTLDSSSITSLADLRGKQVGLGAFGGASEKVARQVLEHYGLHSCETYIAKRAPFDEMIMMLVEGELDIAFFLSSSKNSALIEFSVARRLRFLAIDTQVVQELAREHPYWLPSQLEPFSYPHQDKPITTVRVPMILITHSAVSEADIHSVTRVLHSHKVLGIPESATELGSLPIHKGAARYWREIS